MPAPLLVLNVGSTTLKFRVYDGRAVCDGGTIDRIGEPGGPADHAAAVRSVLERASARRPVLVGHRVVHGGDEIASAVVVDERIEQVIRRWAHLAPLHNPAALAAIGVVRTALPDVPQVAVFDTAFHRTLPPAAYTYAIDADVAATHRLRRYGFHGISVGYVRDRFAAVVGRAPTDVNLIVLHLGGGASATALRGGRSVDTSMGLTPLEGLVMASRSGDLDPATTFALARAGWSLDDIEELYEYRGGLRGLCGDADLRAVISRAGAGDPAARRALDVYHHRLRHYIGAYLAVLGRVDAILFTGGVGENSPAVRAGATEGLDELGIVLDPTANASGPATRRISTMDSRIQVYVVATDEELEIATQAVRAVAST